MPASGPALPLTMAMARDRIREQCFRPGAAGRVGLEAEWHVFDRADAQRIVPLDSSSRSPAGLGAAAGRVGRSRSSPAGSSS